MRRGGPPGGHGGAQYRPKQESTQVQYQAKAAPMTGEGEKAEKGAHQSHGPRQGRPRRAAEKQTEYQPKYRVKGEQAADEDEDHDEMQFGKRDEDGHRDGGADFGGRQGDRSGRQRYDAPQ